VDVAILTETHITSDPNDLLRRLPGSAVLWPGARLLFCPGTGHTEGIVVVLGPRCHPLGPTQMTTPDGGGRTLRVDFTIQGQVLTLGALYGPAQPEARRAFYQEGIQALLPTDGRPFILAGDFNVVLNPNDCVYPPGVQPPATTSRMSGAPAVRTLMEEAQLHDVWREAHPTAKAFTHWSQSANSGARLDRFLVSASFLASFSATSDILPGCSIHTDHLPVSLHVTYQGDSIPRGAGLRGFPLQLLNIPEAVEEVTNLVYAHATVLLADQDNTTLVHRWDAMKETIRKRAWDIYLRRREERLAAARTAETAAWRARQRLITGQGGPMAPADLVNEVHRTRDALRQAWARLLDRPYQAAKILDHHFSDTGSFYFHQLARPPHEPTVIKSLNRPGRAPDAPPATASLQNRAGVNQALDYATSYYSSASPIGLFREKEVVVAAQDELLQAMQRRLPPCYTDLAEGLDGDGLLKPEDIELALRQARRGSVPGVDGLPYEFYRAFKVPLLPVLIRVFNAAFQQAEAEAPLRPLLTGIICLLHKPGKPAEEVSSYRPITLLNCDVKLVMLVMANRLQLPLDYLIDITQSAFLRGRDICDNTRYNLGLGARLVELGIPGWLLQTDLTKAYDSVNRGWLTKVMLTMGLKDTGIVRWTRILLNGTQAKVRINGFFTAPFPVTSSLAQGSAASCMHWLIVMQPFVSYLNQLAHQGRLPSLPMPDGTRAPPISTYADDNKLPLLDPDGEGPTLIKEAHDLNEEAGMAGIEVPKSCINASVDDGRASMNPDLQARHQATGFLLQPRDRVARSLGIPFTRDADVHAREAFGNMAGKLVAAGAAWDSLLLNQTGRVHVARQCLASKPVYQAHAAVPNARDLLGMQQAINRFVARSGRKEEETPRPRALFPNQFFMMLPADKGGVGLPHLKSHFQAMIAKTAWLLFRYTGHPWQQLFRHEAALAAQARPGLPPGYHWLVTCPAAAGSPNLVAVQTPTLRSALRAFLKLGVQRIVPCRHQDFHSAMLELTYHNPIPESGEGIQLTAVQTDAAKGWLRLRDVRAAYQHRDQLPPEVRRDLVLVLARLPAPWRAHVVSPAAAPGPWRALPAQEGRVLLLEGPDPTSGAVGTWELWPSGRLQKRPLDGAQVALPGTGRPALVIYKPKPQAAWNRADYEFMEAQRLQPPSEREELLEPHLVGLWEELQLDPRAWGIVSSSGAKISLLDLTVKDARLLFTHRFLLTQPIPGYQQGGAAWPRAWSLAPDGEYHPPLDNAAGATQLESLGIQGMEELWRRHAAERAGAVPQGEVDQVEAWFRRDAGLAPSQPRTTRTSQAAAAAATQPVHEIRAGFQGVWSRLKDPTIHRPFKITCWRILHCTLGCNAFLADGRPHIEGAAAAAVCEAPECAAHGSVESLTHAFLDCPQAQPAITWMLDTWRALTGQSPPRTARVLLADDPDGWPEEERPANKQTYQLWTRLRVAMLGAIWRVRCSRDEGGDGVTFARRATTMAVESLLDAIKRDWLRTQLDVRELDGGSFCQDWWRGFDVRLKVDDFIEDWAAGGFFCEVRGDPPATQHGPDERTLHLLLGLDTPVPRPGEGLPEGTAEPTQAGHPPDVPGFPMPAGSPLPPHNPPAESPTQGLGDTPPEEACPICYRRLSTRPVTRTPCAHEFHTACLNNWAVAERAAARAPTCPYCRALLPLPADPDGIG
jgi:Reverse transcriptase (RNA-dependent DNA polymerase)/Ring finger domain